MDAAISVLLPVHNAEQYVGVAVESVLQQSFADFELLAFDDGSTDGSLSMLQRLSAKDGRLRVCSRENRGLIATLNELIFLSRGRYLARMDSDDICRPQRFEKQVAYLDRHPECVAVGSRILFIDPKGMPICEAVDGLTHDEIDGTHMSGMSGIGICHPSVMMRRDAVLKVGNYRQDWEHAEDMDLFLRLGEIGKLANLPEVLLEYRQHLRSICYIFGDKQRNAGREVLQAAWSRRGLEGRPTIAEPLFEAEADVHRKWAWWALNARNLPTARKHAVKAVALSPLNQQNWRVLACAMRGH